MASFCGLPVTVIGNSSTVRTCFGASKCSISPAQNAITSSAWLNPAFSVQPLRSGQIGDLGVPIECFEWSAPLEVDTFNPPGRGDMELGNGVPRLDTLCQHRLIG